MTTTSARTVVARRTSETAVRVEAAFGAGHADVRTAVPFLDHMLVVLSRYSGLDLTVSASGDLRHHVIEDVALTLGSAVARLTPVTAARFGDRTVAMDDAVVQAVLDAGGRPFYEGPVPSSLYDHFLRSFCDAARVTLHVIVLRGQDRHHVIEAAFKALGLALRDALADGGAVFSTKGAVSLEQA
jgi:imidazoleglycerol-phosphate dehydratase